MFVARPVCWPATHPDLNSGSGAPVIEREKFGTSDSRAILASFMSTTGIVVQQRIRNSKVLLRREDEAQERSGRAASGAQTASKNTALDYSNAILLLLCRTARWCATFGTFLSTLAHMNGVEKSRVGALLARSRAFTPERLRSRCALYLRKFQRNSILAVIRRPTLFPLEANHRSDIW